MNILMKSSPTIALPQGFYRHGATEEGTITVVVMLAGFY
jgi:hypothetical protein